VCIFCSGKRVIAGRVEYWSWVSCDTGTSATNGPRVVAWTQGNAVPCPSCRPDLYGPIVKVDIKKE
jgi:hypothetical protein